MNNKVFTKALLFLLIGDFVGCINANAQDAIVNIDRNWSIRTIPADHGAIASAM
jgi:hypothetical protein